MNLSNFAERLSELIFDAQLSVPEFAKRLGVGRATINRYLSGERMPSTELTIKMADYFSCTIDFLLGLEDESYSKHFLPCPSFSERLPFLCKHFNVTKYRIHKDTKITSSLIDYWHNGKRKPNIEHIVQLAEYFSCSVDFVLGRTNL